MIPNYNHAEFLPRQLDAVCGQTRPADEILVLDDGSTDTSVEIIARYERKYPTLRLLRNDRNRGLSYSMDRLLNEARCDFLVSAAADDFLLPRFLEKSMAVLERYPQAGMCVSEFVTMETDGTIVNRSREMPASFGLQGLPAYVPPDALRECFRERYLWMSSNTVVARRSAMVAAAGFLPELEWYADSFLFYAIALRHGICVVPEGLAVIRVSPGGYSDAGLRDPKRQRQVLHAIAKTLKSPRNRDLLPVFRRYPALLSIYGREMVLALRAMPRHWDLLLPYVRFLGKRYYRNHSPRWYELVRRELPRRLRQRARESAPAFVKVTVRRVRRALAAAKPQAAAIPSPDGGPDKNTALRDAAMQGNLNSVRRLHQRGADPLARDSDALRQAAAHGNLEVVKYLHQNGADLRAANDEALRQAAAHGHLETVRYLHQNGADLHSADDAPLRAAAAQGRFEVVRYLHQSGGALFARENEALRLAAAHGHLQVLRYLHQNGADLRALEDAPLRAAAAHGHLEVVRYLHRNGGDISAIGSDVVLQAAAHGHQQMVRYLRQNGVALGAAGDGPPSSKKPDRT